MGSENKKWLGINGLDHGVYSLISYVAVYFIFKIKLALIICFIVNTIIWFYFEYSQEKAMFDEGRRKEDNSLKIWKWSKDRLQDFGYPTTVGIIFLIFT